MATNADDFVVSIPEISGKLSYKNGSIIINPVPSKPYPDDEGPFWLKVTQHLEIIQSVDGVGEIVGEISSQSKTVTIFYDNINYCRTGVAGMTELSFRYYQNGQEPYAERLPNIEGTTPYREFGEELKKVMSRGNVYAVQLAKAIVNNHLYSWNGNRRDHPFKEDGEFLDRDTIVRKINDWRGGKLLPSIAQYDLVTKILEKHQDGGGGCNCMIGYDPNNDNNRPAHVGLYHELVHAFYSVKGINLGREDSSSEHGGGRHFEQMSVGLPPHDNKRFSENKYRAALNPAVTLRQQYP